MSFLSYRHNVKFYKYYFNASYSKMVKTMYNFTVLTKSYEMHGNKNSRNTSIIQHGTFLLWLTILQSHRNPYSSEKIITDMGIIFGSKASIYLFSMV